MGKAIDITGARSGRLVAVRYVYTDKKKGNCRIWDCKCDCGETCLVPASMISCGRQESCGCAKLEASSRNIVAYSTKHGLHKHPLYIKWKGMRRRCFTKTDSAYPRYGGKGITICDEWMEFSVFFDWCLSNGWKPGLTIDRIDNDKGYSPDNCRFATGTEQVRNRKKTVYLEYEGEKKPLTEWCEMFGLNKKTVYNRFHNYGWTDVKEILFGRGA